MGNFCLQFDLDYQIQTLSGEQEVKARIVSEEYNCYLA